MAMAALGAAAMLDADPTNRSALDFLSTAATVLDRPELDDQWRWPEDRLTYANAVLPEALLACGVALDERRLVDAALRQLRWLIEFQMGDGVLQLVAVTGAQPGVSREHFDQQPIEAATLADACYRAWRVSGDAKWLDGVRLCVGWFLGGNEIGAQMFDGETGGGYDGLTSSGVNLNQGAESTLALITAMQHAHRLSMVTS